MRAGSDTLLLARALEQYEKRVTPFVLTFLQDQDTTADMHESQRGGYQTFVNEYGVKVKARNSARGGDQDVLIQMPETAPMWSSGVRHD